MQEISALMSRHMSGGWTPLITGSLYLHLVMSHKPGRIDGNADDFAYGGAGSEFIWASLNGGTSLMDLLYLRCYMAAASFRWEDGVGGGVGGTACKPPDRSMTPQEAGLPSEFRLAADWKLWKDERIKCCFERGPESVSMLRRQVANLKKESEFHWYKEDTEIIPDVKPDLGAGVCKLPIKLVIAP